MGRNNMAKKYKDMTEKEKSDLTGYINTLQRLKKVKKIINNQMLILK